MLAKLTMLILLPAGVDADTARDLVGRWQSEPIEAESGKTIVVEFRVLKDKPAEGDVTPLFFKYNPIVLVDQVEAAKGYMVAAVFESAKDLGPGGGKRLLVEFSQQKGEHPLALKVGELSARFARVKADSPKGAASGEFEYLRVTSRQLREGSVAGLKYAPDRGARQEGIQGVLNYLGGQGWDALFQGESETVICKRRVGDRTRWEYLVTKGYAGPDRADVMDESLKEAGSTGWELSAVHEKGEVVIFKRPLPAATAPGPRQEQKPGGVKPSEGKEEAFEWKGEKRTRVVRAVDLGGAGVEFVLLPPGKFDMGSPASDKAAWDSERPPHRVTFTKPVWVGKYPVTKGQFAAFVKATGYKTEAEVDGVADGFDGKAVAFRAEAAGYSWKNTGWEQTDRHPVVNVTWNDAQRYCEWASKEAGRTVRLLTEAEYEYANRGGTSSLYLSGDTAASLEGYANVGDLAREAKVKLFDAAPFDDGEAFTCPVGQFRPNGFGLYDTTGNVMCWCADGHDKRLYARGDVTDPKATVTPDAKVYVLRGSSWVSGPTRCRPARRDAASAAARGFEYGFRVALDGQPGPK